MTSQGNPFPHSMQAEQAVIGGLLLENDSWYEIRGELEAKDFYLADHRVIFQAIGELAERNRPFDVITLSDRLEQRKELRDTSILAYLGTLAKDTPSAANIRAYAAIVRERSQRRALMGIVKRLIQQAQSEGSETNELMADVMRKIEGLANDAYGRPKLFGQHVEDAMTAARNAVTARARGGLFGVSTSLRRLDQRLGGLQPERLYLLAARPGVGKSAIAIQIAIEAAHRGIPVAFLSLEMSGAEVATRAIANAYGLNGSAIFQGYRQTYAAAADRVHRNNGEFKKLPIFVDDSIFQLEQIIARATQLKCQHGVGLIILDYIGLISVHANTRNEAIGMVSRALKLTAKRLKIPVLALSQLNRDPAKLGRRPRLSDLRDSGSLEQDADCCILLHEAGEIVNGHSLPIEIGVLKNRAGQARGWMKDFEFNGRTQRFSDAREITLSGAEPFDEHDIN